MTTTTLRNRTVTAAFSVVTLGVAFAAQAVPISGAYFEDSRCDTIASQFLLEEIGSSATFPANSALQIGAFSTTSVVCVPNDGLANDWQIQMTNLTGRAWTNLFFVANLNIKVGNSDGTAADAGNATYLSDAFHIDAAGSNNSLVESGPADGIFAVGETWRFLVSNFQDPSGTSPMPDFLSVGQFAGTTSTTTADTASILGTPVVPEPTAVTLLGVAAGALLLRRRRRNV